MLDNKIDFVMTWVDDTDPAWREQYNKYKNNGEPVKSGTEIERFRSWDNLKYWFRGVEKFAPWVNKVYFVTCGQTPEWLNTDNPKLVLVNHTDYIPEKYLPVFSSHPIELNLHRIEELSENFVYFNDDIFILNDLAETDFFVNGKSREMAVEFPLYANSKDSFEHILLNMSRVMNMHFNKKQVIKNNRKLWFNPVYKKYLLNNLCMSRFGVFSGILTPHFPSALNKTKMANVWEELYEDFDNTCSHRFRNPEDVNQYLFRFWNILTGDFEPTNFDSYAKFLAINDNNLSKIEFEIVNQKHKILCINDSKSLDDFDKAKDIINGSLEKIFPKKSTFEK